MTVTQKVWKQQRVQLTSAAEGTSEAELPPPLCLSLWCQGGSFGTEPRDVSLSVLTERRTPKQQLAYVNCHFVVKLWAPTKAGLDKV